MKAKTKLALLSAAISCISLAGAATATYAWFVISDSVTIGYNNITVAADSTFIRVHLYDISNTGVFESPKTFNAGEENITNKVSISAASGYDGYTFYNKSANGSTSELTANEANARVLTFGAAVECFEAMEDQNLSMKIAWQPFNASHSPSNLLSSWLRVSVRSCTDTSFGGTDEITKAYYVADSEVQQNYMDKNGTVKAVPDAYTKVQQGSNLALGTYKASTFKYYRISVWMEGTMDANQDIARGGRIKMRTTFSAAKASN